MMNDRDPKWDTSYREAKFPYQPNRLPQKTGDPGLTVFGQEYVIDTILSQG
jgi:hypothetical protein